MLGAFNAYEKDLLREYHYRLLKYLNQLKEPLIRCGYSVSKRLAKLTRFQDFPSQLPGYQDLPPLSSALSYQL